MPAISRTLVARVAQRRNDEVASAREAAYKTIFAPAVHPPGSTPDKTLAQDEAIGESLAWSAGNAVAAAGAIAMSSAYAEGMAFPGYAYLSMLAQRPEYRRMSEILAQEMTRKWIRLTSSASDDDKQREVKIRQLADLMDRVKLRDAFCTAAEHDGYFGRGHLFIDTGTEDDNELKTSIGDGRSEQSKTRVGTKNPVRAIRPVEPVWAYPIDYNSNNPLSADWYTPSRWYVMGTETHATRLLTFASRPVPDMLKPAYSFGGLSLSQMAKPYVDNWLRTRQSVSDLVHSFSVQGVKTNLQDLLMADGDQLMRRIELFNLCRDNRGAMLLDKETEEFFNVVTPLGTLDHLQAQAQEQMSSVSGIPVVKLFGITPSGLNASSDGEVRTFYDTILAKQERVFSSHLRTVLYFLQLSLWDEVDPSITFSWVPLWSLDAAGEAGVRETEARTDATLIDAGVIRPEESRKRVASDPSTPYASLDVDDVPIDPANVPDLEEIPPDLDAAAGGGGGKSAPGGKGKGAGGKPAGSPQGPVDHDEAVPELGDDDEEELDDLSDIIPKTPREQRRPIPPEDRTGLRATRPRPPRDVTARDLRNDRRAARGANPRAAMDAEFKESDHPRKDDGKFGSGSGESASEQKKRYVQDIPTTRELDAYQKSVDARVGEIEAAGEDHPDNREYAALAHMATVLDDYKATPLSQKANTRAAFLAGNGGALAAAGIMRNVKKGGTAEITNVGSLEKGGGTLVMQKLVAAAREKGVRAIDLTSEAREFYTKLGFKPVGGEGSSKMRMALDEAKFNETDHPRKDDGKFGSGSGGGSKAVSSKTPAGKQSAAKPQAVPAPVKGISDAIKAAVPGLAHMSVSQKGGNYQIGISNEVSRFGVPLTIPGHKSATGMFINVDPVNKGLHFGELNSHIKGAGRKLVEAVIKATPGYKYSVTDWSSRDASGRSFWDKVKSTHEGRFGEDMALDDWHDSRYHVAQDEAKFNETDHPRDADGKFTSGGGGGKSGGADPDEVGAVSKLGKTILSKAKSAKTGNEFWESLTQSETDHIADHPVLGPMPVDAIFKHAQKVDVASVSQSIIDKAKLAKTGTEFAQQLTSAEIQELVEDPKYEKMDWHDIMEDLGAGSKPAVSQGIMDKVAAASSWKQFANSLSDEQMNEIDATFGKEMPTKEIFAKLGGSTEGKLSLSQSIIDKANEEDNVTGFLNSLTGEELTELEKKIPDYDNISGGEILAHAKNAIGEGAKEAAESINPDIMNSTLGFKSVNGWTSALTDQEIDELKKFYPDTATGSPTAIKAAFEDLKKKAEAAQVPHTEQAGEQLVGGSKVAEEEPAKKYSFTFSSPEMYQPSSNKHEHLAKFEKVISSAAKNDGKYRALLKKLIDEAPKFGNDGLIDGLKGKMIESFEKLSQYYSNKGDAAQADKINAKVAQMKAAHTNEAAKSKLNAEVAAIQNTEKAAKPAPAPATFVKPNSAAFKTDLDTIDASGGSHHYKGLAKAVAGAIHGLSFADVHDSLTSEEIKAVSEKFGSVETAFYSAIDNPISMSKAVQAYAPKGEKPAAAETNKAAESSAPKVPAPKLSQGIVDKAKEISNPNNWYVLLNAAQKNEVWAKYTDADGEMTPAMKVQAHADAVAASKATSQPEAPAEAAKIEEKKPEPKKPSGIDPEHIQSSVESWKANELKGGNWEKEQMNNLLKQVKDPANKAALEQKLKDSHELTEKKKKAKEAEIQEAQKKYAEEQKASNEKKKKEAEKALAAYSSDPIVHRQLKAVAAIAGHENVASMIGYVEQAHAKAKGAGYEDMSGPEAMAVQLYSESHYASLNEQLRQGAMNEKNYEFKLALSSALQKMPIHAGTVKRGASLSAQAFGLYKPGMIIEERGFMSTSTNKPFIGNYQFHVESKTGRNIKKLSSHSSENEVLFPAGTHFKVTKIEGTTIHMEEMT